jgi:hypothetical protein
MEERQKGFPLIKEVVKFLIAAGAGLLVAIFLMTRQHGDPERDRNARAYNLLAYLSVAEAAFKVDNGAYVVGVTAAGLNGLAAYGFPLKAFDGNVGFLIAPQPAAPASDRPGFIAFAAHRAPGSTLFVYDPHYAPDVQPATAAVYGSVVRSDKLTLFRWNYGSEVIESNGTAQIGLKNGKVTTSAGVSAWIPVQ